MVRRQGIDQLVEPLAGDDLIEFVQGQIDAMIGYPPLRKL